MFRLSTITNPELLREAEGVNEGGDKKPLTPASMANGKTPPAKVAADDDDEDEEYGDRRPSKHELRLRHENKNRRMENMELAAKLAAAETTTAKAIAEAVKEATKTAKKAAEEMMAERETRSNERLIRIELRAALRAANVADEETGLKMIDASGISVNDTGDVVGIAEAITKLKDDKAFLFATKSTTNPGNRTPAPVDVKPVNVKDMTPTEYAAYKKSLGLRA